jgi:hypothetical protein
MSNFFILVFCLFFLVSLSTHGTESGAELFSITHLEAKSSLMPYYMHIRFDDVYTRANNSFLKILDLLDDNYSKFREAYDECEMGVNVRVVKLVSDVFIKCPNRCNANPCLYIENAFEHSCYSEHVRFLTTKETWSYRDISRKQDVQDSFYHYIYKCECFSGFEWLIHDYNDTGGECVPIEIVKSKCEDMIECVTGQCVIINDKMNDAAICKKYHF